MLKKSNYLYSFVKMIFKRTILILICCLGISGVAEAQFISDSTIEFVEVDGRFETLIERYNKTHEIRGYRIQIISSSRSDQARKMKSRFASQYKNVEVHETYQQPFFIVKVGDFLTKLEAEKFHREIEEQYPGSFILPDEVDPYEQYGSLNSTEH